MSKTRFTQWIVLACIGSLAACTSGEGGTAGNTELNVVVPNGYDAGSSAPALIDIQQVEYTVDCSGNTDTFLDNNASFDNAVTINGNLEVQDGRTNPGVNVCDGGNFPGATCINPASPSPAECQGTSPIPDGNCVSGADYGGPLPGSQTEIWQGFMDLPPGPCTVELRARDSDGEVICTAQEPFAIAADSTTKVNIVLICDISFQAPVGMLDIDGTFSFNVGNFCPDLFILNCLDSIPVEDFPFPPGPGICSTAGSSCFFDTECPAGETCLGAILLATTTCEVRFRDGDSTCGAGCDPQSCVPNGTTGLTCTPGPDPGVSTTVTCTDLNIDCDLNPLTPETECIYNGDTLGILGVGTGNPATFAVACTPPALGGTPGVVGTCTAVTTDGDLDCDKTKTVEVTCPGLSPCAQVGCTDGVDCAFCDDGDLCTSDLCDDSSGSAQCPNDLLPVGTACDPADPTATCDAAGACISGDCNLVGGDTFCDDGNQCTSNICDPSPGTQCITTDLVAGTPCSFGGGTLAGACDTGACVPICDFNPACPDPGVECQVASCDPVDGTCGSQNGPDGVTCDFSGPGSADGSCSAGACIFTPDSCNFTQTGDDTIPQQQVVSVGCTNNVTTAQSPFPFILEVDVPVPVFGGGGFTAGLDGVGFFPEFFLDAAQGVVCGGLRQAQLVDFVSTVQVRSGATGPDVPLGIDIATLVPGPVSFCNFPTDQTCIVGTDCLGGVCNAPILIQDLPVLDGTPLSPGGCDADTSACPIPGPPVACDCSACDALGAAKAAQCSDNGFCQNGSLVLQLQADTGVYTAAATGPVLWGWADQGVPGLSVCPVGTDCGTLAGRVDGCYQLPPASFALPTAPIGIRVNAGGLAVPIQCAMGEDGGTCSTTATQGCLVDADCPGAETCIGVGVDDDVICPTPDSVLIACPVL